MKNFEMNPNLLEKTLGKTKSEFTKNDIINFIEKNGVKMVNFKYVGGDGKLKTLNFIISGKKHLEELLTTGERVDGSSLFPYVEASSSDLYVVPRYSSAFINPFNEIPTVELLCSYFDKDGKPLASSSEYILRKAHESLRKSTGYTLQAMGELEYYVISQKDSNFMAVDQKGYHESMPFAKSEKFRCEAMQAIAQVGGLIKYGHSEVGNFIQDNISYEQNEIEFTPTNLEDAADSLLLAKWIIRMLAHKHGVTVSFAPKITVGKAGSGLHIHFRLVKEGKNLMIENDKLSDIAKKSIAGILDLSASLTAFGNTIPTSYLRLVPHQEAPTAICWGDRNRSVLVRVPLGWLGEANEMIKIANPQDKSETGDIMNKQTVEFRCPDGSADIYLLLAGLTVAIKHGIEMKDSLKLAEQLYVNVNIFKDENADVAKKLKTLPVCCFDSADCLNEQREIYQKENIFTKGTIDGIIKKLKSFDDKKLSERLHGNTEETRKIVDANLHCG
ncbi:MAG: glutamine synthetase family protein [Bacteroidales bacterium]|nr:glutamine synthetase family protein [Bacteroidales bacterium]